MNKDKLKELFELEQQLGINEKDRFHHSEKGKELYDMMQRETEKEYIAMLSERVEDHKNRDIVAEKAKWLYYKFYNRVYKYVTTKGFAKTNNISKDTAKQLALIVVEEMLNEPKMIYAGDGINDPSYKLWKDVKEYIINL